MVGHLIEFEWEDALLLSNCFAALGLDRDKMYFVLPYLFLIFSLLVPFAGSGAGLVQAHPFLGCLQSRVSPSIHPVSIYRILAGSSVTAKNFRTLSGDNVAQSYFFPSVCSS